MIGENAVEAPEAPEAPVIGDENLSPVEPNEDELTSEDNEGEAPEPIKEEAVKFDEKQQAKVNDIVAKKTFEKNEQIRKNEVLEQRIKEIEAKIPVPSRPEIPQIPDALDLDFDAKVLARDKVILEQANYDSQERVASEQARQAELSRQQEYQTQLNDSIKVFTERSQKLNIKAEDLKAAGGIVAQQGLSDPVVAHILDEPTGPQITVYLSKNPLIAEELNRLTPMQAAVRISTELREAASKMVVTPATAPDPAETFTGSGSKEGQRGPKGATYE